MEIKSIKLVYFSPTGTSKTVIQGIAKGFEQFYIEQIDVTKPEARLRTLQMNEDDILLVASPVYMGRIPALFSEWLSTIKANKTPTVCIVVYGNRAFENSLLELKDILQDRGCMPIAGAAFIGEHSFSSTELPTAEGRPDSDDLNYARQFGQKVWQKLSSHSKDQAIEEVNIPGESPYGGTTKLWSVDFIAVNDSCINQGICAEVCPVGAINSENAKVIDEEKCISCCACIKNCPKNARTIKPSQVKEAAIRLSNLYRERKEPVVFL